MGWRRGEIHTVAVMGRPISAQRWTDPSGSDRAPLALPDPFKYANDDYSVLEWARSHIREAANGYRFWSESDRWWGFYEALSRVKTADYRVGDYARAALTVLDRDESKHEPENTQP
jgi:hypothetical protein